MASLLSRDRRPVRGTYLPPALAPAWKNEPLSENIGELERRAEEERRVRDLKDHLYRLAMSASSEEIQIRATEAWLDRQEGKPVQRNVNVNVNDVSGLGDHELESEIARLAGGPRAVGSSAAGKQAPRLLIKSDHLQ